MLFTGTANPLTGAPGAALLYVLAGLTCWPLDAPTGSMPSRARALIGEQVARVAWSAIWLGCAVLWLLPGNNRPGRIHDAIAGAPSGSKLLSRVLDAAATAATGHETTIAISLAAASATIGLAVMFGWHPQTFLAMQISLSVLYWILGQGFGGILSGRATDIGTPPAMMMIALMVPPAARTRNERNLRVHWGRHRSVSHIAQQAREQPARSARRRLTHRPDAHVREDHLA